MTPSSMNHLHPTHYNPDCTIALNRRTNHPKLRSQHYQTMACHVIQRPHMPRMGLSQQEVLCYRGGTRRRCGVCVRESEGVYVSIQDRLHD
jgi:hypothetical protein